MSKKTDDAAFRSQQKIAFMSLLSELPNLIAQFVLAFLSGSLIIALDAVDSLSNVIQSGLSFLLSKKLQEDDSFKYDYGMGKIEAFGSLISTLFLYIGLAAVTIASVFALINPGLPRDALIFAMILKIINIAIDAFLLYKQKKTVKGVDGSFIDSNTALLKKNLMFDLAAFSAITTAWLLRSVPAAAYIEPVMCITCAILIALQNIRIIKEASNDLLDKTLDEKIQMQILKCVSGIWGSMRFQGIRTRRSGHIIYIDLMVSLKKDTTYEAIYKACETFDSAVKEYLPNSVSSIVIKPRSNI